MTKSKMLKTLGLYWDYSNDHWYINEPEFQIENISKHSVLSDIARLYDPMGFLAPLCTRETYSAGEMDYISNPVKGSPTNPHT